MKSYAALSGETRVVPIIGDPIAQVKSPADVTEALLERGRNCVVVPIHVTPSDVHDFIRGVSLAKNVDGMIVTVPHKFPVHVGAGLLVDSLISASRASQSLTSPSAGPAWAGS